MKKQSKQFLVALHAYDRNQVLKEADKILTPKGAHGVLLVNNGFHISSSEGYPNLFDLTVELKERYPEYIVGINPLDLKHFEAVRQMFKFQDPEKCPDILWTDDGGVVEVDEGIQLYNPLKDDLKRLRPKYYGGIAFKYLPQPKNLAGVAQLAATYFDVVVTSGEKTGMPPSIEKVKLIKSLIGTKPLANASGISVDNVGDYVRYVDVFIVGTSLLQQKENQFIYSKEKVEEFRAKLDTLQ